VLEILIFYGKNSLRNKSKIVAKNQNGAIEFSYFKISPKKSPNFLRQIC
jgi:hypothetical protein